MNHTSQPFDEVLRLIPAPVTIVGVRGEREMGGLTAAWVTRVSIQPPLLLVAVGHERHTWGLLAQAAEFTISVLREGQVETARLFGLHSRRDVDKWGQTEHVLLGEGTPAVAGCAAWFLCRTVSRFVTGDHDCFVGEITLAETVSGEPALPMRGADYGPRESGD